MPSVGRLLGEESIVIVTAGRLNRIMVDRIGLNDDVAPWHSSSRPARHLRQKLKRALGRAKVRQVQDCVGIHDADGRNQREIKSLGDHLGTDDNVNVMSQHPAHQTGMIDTTFERVPIPAQHTGIGQ